MSATTLDRPAPGHNSDKAAPTITLDPELLVEQLKLDHADLVASADALVRGVGRLIVTYGKVKVAETLPEAGANGDIVCIGADAEPDGKPIWEFHRLLGKSWGKLTGAQAVNLLLPTVKLPDAATVARVTSFIKGIKETAKKIENHRVGAKQPFDAAADTVQGFFKAGMKDPLDAAAKGLEGALTVYQREQAAIERQRREDEANRLRLEAEAAAAAAAKTEHADVIETAEVAAVEADKATKRAAAPVADLARVSGSYGGVSAATTVWSWEIEDEAKIPREYFVLDTGRIDREVKSQKNGFAVPGIKVKSDIKASVR